jgi:hypothetical protein
LSLRFQADADLNPVIVRGLRRREPAIDFQLAVDSYPPGTPDSIVLELAAANERVLVSRDVTTMPVHFATFVAAQESPGLILVPSDLSIGEVIERLLFLWAVSTPEQLRNRIEWL